MSIVVHKLSTIQQAEILDHLRTLSDADRRLRFGVPMQDEALARCIERIDFYADKVFGIYEGLTLAGVGHLAINAEGVFGELGLSVTPQYRRRGHGGALLARAALHARNIGLRTLYMHCLGENLQMIRLARRARLLVIADCGQADTSLALAQPDVRTLTSELMHDQIALVDYLLKRELRLAAQGRGAASAIMRGSQSDAAPQ